MGTISNLMVAYIVYLFTMSTRRTPNLGSSNQQLMLANLQIQHIYLGLEESKTKSEYSHSLGIL